MKSSNSQNDQHDSQNSPKLSIVPTEPNTILKAERLGLMYAEKAAFKDVTLNIRDNSITAIIGPSGCGKTSFLLAISGLANTVPTTSVEGHAYIRGHDIYDARANVTALRRKIGIVFQKPTPFPFSIVKNIQLPLREHGVKNKHELSDITHHNLQQVGLWDEVKDRLHESALSLSGGQQQRLCIARALCLKPDVLLMDEPCSALDPISSAVVEELIVELKRKYSVMLVTHNLAQAKRVADDAAFFWTHKGVGKLIEQGSAKRLFSHPQEALTAAYISGAKG